MAKNSLDKCRKYSDFRRFARRKAREGMCDIDEGGSHLKVRVPGKPRPVTISRDSGEPSKPMRKALFKQLVGLGLSIIVAIAIFC